MRLIDGALRLSPTDLASFLGCRHRTGLDLADAHGMLERPFWKDPLADALRARGEEHERAFVDSLRAARLTICDLRDHDRADDTRNALIAGVDVVVQAPLQNDVWRGRADILRRVERPSGLGAWSYEIYDTKLARDTRAGTILQLSVYAELIAQIQGVAPERFHVVTPPALSIHSYRVDDYAAYYRLMKQKLLETIEIEWEGICTTHYPEPVDDCEFCRWWQRCNDRRRADDHLSFVAGMTRLHSGELVSGGYATLAAAAAIPLPLPFTPSRGARATFERLREQARVQVEQRTSRRPVYELLDLHRERGFSRLPEPSPGDVFLDLEGDPFARDGGREYLLGLGSVGPHNRPDILPLFALEPTFEYRSWWAFDDQQERAAFEALIDLIVARLEADSGMHVYHFGHYEPSAMKRLMGRYATRADELDRLLRGERFVDLHAIVRQALRAGVESYSIKKLEPLYAFDREVALDAAGANLRQIELALESQAPTLIADEVRIAVEGYNRDDCRSTLALRDWLEELRAELSRCSAVPRPRLADETPSDKVLDLDRDTEHLRDRLLHDIPGDPHARTPEQQVQWMLAYLIDWHRREEKADWWEFFRLCDLPEEELLDERKAIAGLQFVERVSIVTRANTGKATGSVIDRYAYPGQDVDIRKGDALKLQTKESWGTVESIDRDARWIDVRKGRETAEIHAGCAFAVPVVPTHMLQRSVMRLAEGFLQGKRNAATDLLFREPPRVRAADAAGLKSRPATANPVDFAVRVAADLDRTTFAIQGPPGAGKTYAGARMICALVEQGLRVGVTAVSHKVIRNLLDATAAEARKRGVSVALAAKVTEARGASDSVREIEDNDDALAALASRDVNVLGATAWLWAREDAVHAVDVLFVDEAGQMSLANVLAVAQAATSIVLLGDPQQLEQPASASHPDGIGISALDHLLEGAQTMPENRGLFLPNTWRLAPEICAFTSEVFYEGKLKSTPGLEHQRLAGNGGCDGAGLWWIPALHDGNQNSSREEIDIVEQIVNRLLAPGSQWIDEHRVARQLTANDLRIVAPYNAQVNRIAERLQDRAVPVGTVDKFQGQEAPVVIYSMTSSSPADAPRGMEFLFSLNRLNVATSRARCAVILVASPRLFEPECRTPRQMRLASALCRYREMAARIDGSKGGC